MITKDDLDFTVEMAHSVSGYEHEAVQHEILEIALSAFDKYIIAAGTELALQVINAMVTAIEEDAPVYQELHSVFNTMLEIGEL